MTDGNLADGDPFADSEDDAFRRTLGLRDITLLGVGGTIGVGIFVLTGVAAAQSAGPAVVFSFLIAAFACGCAALCYAELASMIPGSGSAYLYTRATLGALVAWIVGWNLVLEYLFAASTVAVGWASYFQSLIGLFGLSIPAAIAGPPIDCTAQGCHPSGAVFNLPAMAIVAFCTMLLARGTLLSARVNAVITAMKITVILLVIVCGAAYVNSDNLVPLVPPNTGDYGHFGWSGVVRAAGLVFFAYIGFDQVSTCSQEARNARRDIPIAILLTLLICTTLYVGMAIVMTGLTPYQNLDVANPVYVAIAAAGPDLAWLKPVVAFGATIGLTSAIIVTLYGQTRIFYAMGRDRAVSRRFAALNDKTGVPLFGTVAVGSIAAVVAGLAPITLLGELVSIGTLLAFSIVCIGVMVLRVRRPELHRGFRAPMVRLVAPMGIVTSAYMMASLPGSTWLRLAIWLAVGLAIYVGNARNRERRDRAPVA